MARLRHSFEPLDNYLEKQHGIRAAELGRMIKTPGIITCIANGQQLTSTSLFSQA